MMSSATRSDRLLTLDPTGCLQGLRPDLRQLSESWLLEASKWVTCPFGLKKIELGPKGRWVDLVLGGGGVMEVADSYRLSAFVAYCERMGLEVNAEIRVRIEK